MSNFPDDQRFKKAPEAPTFRGPSSLVPIRPQIRSLMPRPAAPPVRLVAAAVNRQGLVYGRSYPSMTTGEEGPPSPAVVKTLSDIQEFIREGLDYFESVHHPEKKERAEFRILIGLGTLMRGLTLVGLPTEGLCGRGEGFDDWSYLRKLRDALGLSDSFLARIKAYRNATAHAEPWTVHLKSPEADCETLRLLVVEVFFALKEWSVTAKARTSSELAASFYRYLSENNSFLERLPPAA